MPDGAAWRHWCKGDGVAQLQDNASFPPRTSYHVHPDPGDRSKHVNTRSGPQSVNHTQHLPQQLVRSHTRPVSTTPASVAKVPYKSATDNICEYFPPPGTRARKQEEGKCAALPLLQRPAHEGSGSCWPSHPPPPPCLAQVASLPGVLVSQVRRARQDGRLGAAQRQPRRLPARGLRSRRAQDHHVHVQRHARREAGGQGRPVSVVSIAIVSTAIVAMQEGKGDRSAAPQVGT